MNTIENIYHFTKTVDSLKDIIINGFKPSYAKEQLDNRNIIVPMVSFSNILLRDVGTDQVMFYGDYAIGFSRSWAIMNELNPVIYTYSNGILHNSISTFFYNSLLLNNLESYESHFQLMSKHNKGQKLSDLVALSNTPKEVLNILDYLSVNYSKELFNAIIEQAKSIYDANLKIVLLAKPYLVKASNGKEFVAYNDREWRKTYVELNFEIEGNPEYDKWINKAKPHFDQPQLILNFTLEDIKVILVKEPHDVTELIKILSAKYGTTQVDDLISNKLLIIDIKDNLIINNF